MVCYIIFAHCNTQNNEDLQDIIDNIKYFSEDESDFIVNHPTINHSKIRTRHQLGPLNYSSFIYGAFIEIVKSITEEELNKYDHFCLVSANQYFINKIKFKPQTNYFQFYNSADWENYYHGISTEKIVGNYLRQPYGLWDNKEMYKVFGIENPMASNWECGTLTKESMKLCKENINKSIEIYPNTDLISLFPGYMALKSYQEWEWPSFFGTFDPSCKEKNHIITINQLETKRKEGYFSIKRVGYSKNCLIKDYIRKNYMV
jgi:hypothetical protein